MNITPYHQLQNQLQNLSDNLGDYQRQPGALISQGQGLVTFWQAELASLTGDDLAPEICGQWRSLHTELYRGLRLLNTDLLFLQGSRTASTQTEKQRQIQTRLAQLRQYCQGIIDLD
jgi:hypothetical protein